MRAPLLLCLLTLVSACTTPLSPREPLFTERELLFGDIAADRGEKPIPMTAEDAFAIDDTMRQFVATHVDAHRAPANRLGQLLIAMKERGLASLDYDDGITRSARDTFYAGTANCLSFTMLFVALAREAGLRVSFQEVEVPPTWSKSGEMVVVRNHINALVLTSSEREYIVDFNLDDFDDKFDRWRVSDEYAQALFYNNLAAEALVSRDYDTSFAYLREALRLDGENTPAWSNLGLWYLRSGHRDHAEAAYLRALDATPRDPTVLTNLAALYASLGEQELAEAYSQRIRSYQQSNPYYHFAAAQTAFEQRRFETALSSLNHAVRLQTDDHEFHVLRARTYLELGRKAAAARSFARAEALGAAPNLQVRYEAETSGLITGEQR